MFIWRVVNAEVAYSPSLDFESDFELDLGLDFLVGFLATPVHLWLFPLLFACSKFHSGLLDHLRYVHWPSLPHFKPQMLLNCTDVIKAMRAN